MNIHVQTTDLGIQRMWEGDKAVERYVIRVRAECPKCGRLAEGYSSTDPSAPPMAEAEQTRAFRRENASGLEREVRGLVAACDHATSP